MHEDEIPDLQILVIFVNPVGPLLVEIAPVEVNLRAGTTGAGVAHRPPVVLFAKAADPRRRRAGLDPEAFGLVIVGVDGEPEALQGQFEHLD